MIYWNNLLQEIMNTKEIVIYGAGLMGKTVKRCLEEAPYYVKIKIFIVESLTNNPDDIDGIPVVDLDHAAVYRDTLLLVALHEKNMSGALRNLAEAGFHHVRPLSFDSDDWSDIRGNWFHAIYDDHRNNYTLLDSVSCPIVRSTSNTGCLNGDTLPDHMDFSHAWMRFDAKYLDKEAQTERFRIYVAHSTADHVVKKEAGNHSFEIPIQVGAALTDKRITGITDNQGEHISEKNKKYCELTALYWIWKNDKTKYAGLSHYRRRFVISEKMSMWLPESDIDVVLTIPVLNIRGVKQQYCIDHIASDWDVMMESIRCLCPEYLKTADKVQKGNYYYAYNMFIARREILHQYCEWLFPILFRCESEIGERQDTYQGRYIGFLSERLMTIFFEHHKDNYKTAIAKKHFILEME